MHSINHTPAYDEEINVYTDDSYKNYIVAPFNKNHWGSSE